MRNTKSDYTILAKHMEKLPATAQEDILNSCRKNPLFRSFSQQAQQQLLRIARRVYYQAEEFVFHANVEQGRECFLVESGSLMLTLGSGKMRQYNPGDLFGEITVLNQRPRMGSVRAQTDVSLIAFDGSQLYDLANFEPAITLEIILGLTGFVIGYLDEAEFKQATTNLIPQGESITLEFKQSLSKTIKKKVLETICAFFNTRGGVILLGVKDDGEVIGLKVASEKMLDEYALSIIGIIKDRVGPHFATYLGFNQEKINDKLVLRINVAPTPDPAIMQSKRGEELFYIRTAASNSLVPNIKGILSYYDQEFVSKRAKRQKAKA